MTADARCAGCWPNVVVCWPDSGWPNLTAEPTDAVSAGRIHFRALADIPAGEELWSSYTPLGWPLSDDGVSDRDDDDDDDDEDDEDDVDDDDTNDEDDDDNDAEGTDRDAEAVTRARHLVSHYGFSCSCPRCMLEGGAQLADPAEQEEAELKLTLWLLRHVCAADGCGGTMVPPSTGTGTGTGTGGGGGGGGGGGLRTALGHLVGPSYAADGRGCACNGCGRLQVEAEYWAAVEAELVDDGT